MPAPLPLFDNIRPIQIHRSHELRDEAFIRLTAMPVRGVLDWSEVQYVELPTAVQAH